jgi:hypothetical protein
MKCRFLRALFLTKLWMMDYMSIASALYFTVVDPLAEVFGYSGTLCLSKSYTMLGSHNISLDMVVDVL